MRVEITDRYAAIEITVPDRNYLYHIRKFLKRYGLEDAPVREIMPDGRKKHVPWIDIYEGG